MRHIKQVAALLFTLIILVPLAAFHWEPEIASEIDNRMLAKNPFSAEVRKQGGDLTKDIENYISDRIGFRDYLILAYEVLNDKLFGEMIHPSYTYGQDGYVFSKIRYNREYGKFEQDFADMLVEIRDYCDARSVPFLFVLNPSKMTILEEYLPVGVTYDGSWVDQLLASLADQGVPYVDNRQTLKNAYEANETVFNQKYDAVHWNDWGAFYGCNAILNALCEEIPGVHVNSKEELTISERLETSLPGAKFPIHEYVPALSLPVSGENLYAIYNDEVERNNSFRGFGYYVNQSRLAEGAPKALVFQGSYMNGLGAKYMINGLGEYIYIHGYENTINFSYYYQIFQPDCVIVEVAEHALVENYYNDEQILAMELNPTLADVKSTVNATRSQFLESESFSVEKGHALTKLIWTGPAKSVPYVWAILGEEFDMHRNTAGAFEVTVKNDVWEKYGSDLKIVFLDENTLWTYEIVPSSGTAAGTP